MSAIVPSPDSIVTAGDGPGLVLAHGAGGSVPANFGRVLDVLSAQRTLVGINYPGTQGRALPPTPLALEDLADQVVASGLAAGLDRFPILGLSLGSAVAVTAAIRHPERVSGLILTVGLSHSDAQVRSVVRLWRALAEIDDDLLATLILDVANSPDTLAALDPAAAQAATAAIRDTLEPGGVAQATLAGSLDIRPLLQQVAVPTTVFVAGADRIVLPSTSRELATGIAGARLIEYERAGHIFTPDEEQRWIADVSAALAADGL